MNYDTYLLFYDTSIIRWNHFRKKFQRIDELIDL